VGGPADPPQGCDVFWGEIPPCDHVVQIYAEDSVFLDSLEGFVASALSRDEAAVVIATPAHLHGLEARLTRRGLDLQGAILEQRYIARSAEETLDRFMVEGWPDAALFQLAIHEILEAAGGSGNRRIRAFGEMVAILWSRGQVAATLQLEALWSGMTRSHCFPLFCAYPRAVFTRNPVESLECIRQIHSRVVA
jgi:hypothetical protein